MSLINEALKKAQKLRSGDPAGTIAPMPGGTARVTKRGEARSTQQLVLIASGAVVLVVLSVVATFWFINRTPAPKPSPKPIVVKPADNSAPSPVIVGPSLKPPVTPPETAPTKPATAPVVVEQSPPANTPSTAPVTTAPSKPPVATAPVNPAVETPPSAAAGSAQSAPASSTPAQSVATDTASSAAATQPVTPAAPTPTPAAAAPASIATDPRVHAFVDAVKVAGIRSASGGDSRVLMNDRVFRVNDIVDRNLGLRLTKVEANALTFTDSNGAIYVKNF